MPSQMRFPGQYVARYVRRNPVKGWLAPFSTEVIARLSMRQLSVGIRGGFAEIGVHHGKLFFVLYLTSAADETALAIDVFAAQHLNLDKSGCGDKGIFLDHARRWSATPEGQKIIEDSSLNLVPEQILAACGRVRMFSIDGAHTEEATINDLRLAEAVLLQDGIVILDDCFNEAWPEVCAGVANYIRDEHKLLPFAITPGKVMFCSPHRVASTPAS
jgi:hypothetical protein